MKERTSVCLGCNKLIDATGKRGRMPLRCQACRSERKIAPARVGTCKDCGKSTFGGVKGTIPKRCPDCYKSYRAEYFQQWGATRPKRIPKIHDVVCDDCMAHFQWSGKGVPPARCAECTKKRRIAANRESGRLRRAAKKAGNPQRIGVCTECMTEFIGPARGSMPSKCPPCTEAWNKTRWKSQVNRNKNAQRAYLLKKYGITPGEWDMMYAEQGGKCAICDEREEDSVGRLHVDHDHDTGKVRALLCQACNTTLGKMKDSPERLRAAADYIELHRVIDR